MKSHCALRGDKGFRLQCSPLCSHKAPRLLLPALFAAAPLQQRGRSNADAHDSHRAVKNHKEIMVALQEAEKETQADVSFRLRNKPEGKKRDQSINAGKRRRIDSKTFEMWTFDALFSTVSSQNTGHSVLLLLNGV